MTIRRRDRVRYQWYVGDRLEDERWAGRLQCPHCQGKDWAKTFTPILVKKATRMWRVIVLGDGTTELAQREMVRQPAHAEPWPVGETDRAYRYVVARNDREARRKVEREFARYRAGLLREVGDDTPGVPDAGVARPQ